MISNDLIIITLHKYGFCACLKVKNKKKKIEMFDFV